MEIPTSIENVSCFYRLLEMKERKLSVIFIFYILNSIITGYLGAIFDSTSALPSTLVLYFA